MIRWPKARRWLNRWKNRFWPHPVPANRRRTSLRVERLEDRLTPSTFLVTDTNDTATDAGSLRQAIAHANADALVNDTATITFSAALAGQSIALNNSLVLSNTTPGVTIVIDGSAASGVTITTGGSPFSLFTVNAHVTADFNSLTISQGSTPGSGGGITNAGTLTVENCTLSGNSADNGGGIYNKGTLIIQNSTLSGNSATAQGGAVENHGGTLTIQNSTLSGNSADGGAGVDNYRGTLTIQNSDFSTNTANSGGGGIENNLGTLSVQGTTLDSNAASAGDGGGIFNIGGMTVLDSTLSNNTSSGNGAGIENFLSTSSVLNTTFSGNSAGVDGGGIGNDGTLTILCSTLSGNSATSNGGGIANNGILTLQNSIVSANTAGVDGEDIDGGITTDLGNNLLGTAVYSGPAPATDVITDNPDLAPLGNYGGAMQTMPVLPNSPASNAGNASAAGMPATDQNGNARVVAGHLDIGAYQTQADPFIVTTAADPGGVAGQLALREAISLANLYAGSGTAATITFAASLQGATITLSQSDLELSGAPATGSAVITITGQPGLTIDGGGANTVLQIDAGVTAVVSGLIITDGSGAGDGGGILNNGTLTLSNCTVTGNSATGGDGGGIDSTGILTLSNCTFSNNNAAGNGGGIASSGTLTVQNCTLADNSASDGGGIENDGTLTLQNSTLEGNSATEGGAVNNNGTLTVLISTISNNTASDQAGGIVNNQTLTVQNTILSGNSDTAGSPDVEGGITTDLGNNLLGTAVYSGPAPKTDVITDDPGLAPLDNYGGALQTMPVLPNSPARNAGNAAAAGLPATDQNGNARIVAGHLDIGAYQTPANPFIVTTAADPGGIAGQLALGEAINLANAYAGSGAAAKITFADSLRGTTIKLTLGVLELSGAPATGSAVITIAGQPRLAINGGGAGSVFQIDAGVTAVLTGLTITNGVSSTDGGGILNNGTLTISNCTVSGNSTTGGDGGGIDNTGVLTVSNCTFSNNSASGNGGGIASSGTLTVQNCTLANNSATDGGGIENDGTLTVQNSTLSRNSATSGGGIANTQTLKLQNTILSGNTAGTGPDLFGSLTTDQGYNLLGTKVYPGKAKATDIVTDTPGLVALGDYGGPTQTMPLLPASKAHGAGNVSAGGLPATDERGFSRVVSGHLDIGAAQTQLQPFLVTTAADPGGQSGALSLREGVNLADAYAAAGTSAVITFAASLKDDTITLTQGVLEFSGRPATGSATITVNGGRVIELSGNGVSTVLQVDAGVNAVVTGLAVTHGYTTGSGGGIVNNGTLTLQNCTLSGNVAQLDGGGIANNGTLTLQNGTLSGNSATGTGGAISSSGTLTIQSSTLSANTATKGGGIASSGTLSLQNSIVSANTASSASPDIFGTLSNDAGNNLLGTALASSASPISDIFTDLPGLAALGSYGGFLQTMALLPGSQALGTGTAHLAPTTDERGTARRKNSRGQILVDIGAFESAGFAITIAAGSGAQTAKTAQAFNHPLTVSVKALVAYEPVNGGIIVFMANTSGKGASALLSSSTATITDGVAKVSATGNGTAGAYTVSATTGTASVSFSMRNT